MADLNVTQTYPMKSIDQLLIEVFKGNYAEFRLFLKRNKLTELNLEHKQLGKNKLNDLGLLSQALQGTEITSVNLSYNEIDGLAAARFSQNLPGTQIFDIDMSNNQIGSGDNCAEFIKNLRTSKVKILHLSGNNLGDTGVVCLAVNLHTGLKKLFLDDNQLGDEGIKTLIKNLKGKEVDSLSLNHNNITTKGIVDCEEYLKGTIIDKIEIYYNKKVERATIPVFKEKIQKHRRDLFTTLFVLSTKNNLDSSLLFKPSHKESTQNNTAKDLFQEGAEIIAHVPKDVRKHIISFFPGYTDFMENDQAEATPKKRRSYTLSNK